MRKRSQLAILVHGQDYSFSKTLENLLVKNGYSSTILSADAAPLAISRLRPAIVGIDVGMPGKAVEKLLSLVRRLTSAPIIVSLDEGCLLDRPALLDQGADDFIAKPFCPREWLARVRALLRRVELANSPARGDEAPGGGDGTFEVGGWVIDEARRVVTAPDGQVCELTATEFAMIEALFRNPNRVLTREQILDLVRGPCWKANDRLIDNQIGRLRRKLAAGSQESPIRTIRGAGYMLAGNVSTVQAPRVRRVKD